MRTIETTAVVTAEHTVTIQLPTDIPPGERRIVVVIENRSSADESSSAQATAGAKVGSFTGTWPVHDLGPWPEGFTVRREDIYGDDGR
jgi:hypothetical protein